MPNPTPFATNQFGVAKKDIDFGNQYSPTVQMYHGGTIIVNEKIVGRIDSWTPGSFSREGAHVYELGNRTWGLPVDYVPGKATEFMVSFTRTEVWEQELEKAFGYPATFENLTDQTYPFVADEYLYKGAALYKSWRYLGCWFTKKSPNQWEAEGNGIIKVECEMAYVRRFRSF